MAAFDLGCEGPRDISHSLPVRCLPGPPLGRAPEMVQSRTPRGYNVLIAKYGYERAFAE